MFQRVIQSEYCTDSTQNSTQTKEEGVYMKFVLTHPLAPDGMDLLKSNDVEVYIANSPDIASYLDHIKDADGLLIRVGVCDSKIISQCPKLKVIGRTGVGVDNVDVAFASQRGIPVVITPGANARSVAEHAVALMFALAKNFREADAELHNGNWKIRDAGRAIELSGKKVGIIGVGNIGQIVAKLCQGIGMKCAGFSHSHNRKKIEAAGCEYYEDFDQLLKDCDFITIHNPLTPKTQNMISMAQLKEMKKTAFLINTSRGAIVNESDLATAVNEGIIAGAAVDVYSTEPAKHDNPVFSAKHIICTPHSAALTKEASNRMGYQLAKGCIAVCQGIQWQDVADLSAYKQK